MSKPILAVDVDEPIVQTGKMWKRYLDSHYSLKHEYRFTLPDPLPYNLSELYITTEDSDGLEFFDYFKLYDDVTPRDDALLYLPLIADDYDVIFVSKIMGNHYCSKLRMLDKYFPFHKGFYGCDKTKAFITCDYIVDDCYSNLNDFYLAGKQLGQIKFRQDYKENVEPLKNYPIVYNWEMVHERLCR